MTDPLTSLVGGIDPLSLLAVLLLVTLVLGYLGAASWAEGSRQQEAAIARGRPAQRSSDNPERGRDTRERWLRRRWVGRSLGRRLDRAGLTVRVADALGGVLVVAVAAGALAGWLLGRLAAVLAVLAVVQVFLVVLRWLADRRLERFVAQLPQLSRLLANGASAGLSLRRSIATASIELSEPARTELVSVSDALAVGTPLENALAALDERLPSRELAVLVKTLVIQVRSGGGVVTALQRMATTLDERKKLQGEMRSVLSAVVYTAYLVIALALGGVLLVTGGDRDVLGLFFTDPVGQAALVFALALGGAGLLVVRRSVRAALRS